MTTPKDVRNVMDNLVQKESTIRLKHDQLFLMTVAELYDDHVQESEDEDSVWSLEDYTVDKLEWLEQSGGE